MMQIRPNQSIENLAPYRLADLKVPLGKQLISLAQNELFFSPSEAVQEAIRTAAQSAQNYPDPNWRKLSAAIASTHDLNPERILCSAGSMELLDILARVYLSANDHVVMGEYGYSFFATVTQMYGAQISKAKENDYTVCVDELLNQVKHNTKIVFIANPGNPTGTRISAAEIRRLRASLNENILLIIDEAYAEFSCPSEYPPLFDLIEQENTVVLRTFSKIYGLAGLRAGWGYFPESIHANLRKALLPSNLSSIAQNAAEIAIKQTDLLIERRARIKQITEQFCDELGALGLAYAESQTNFVLIDFKQAEVAKHCFNHLRNQGIILRPVDGYGLTHCLRVTISTEDHMQQTIEHLSQALSRVS